LWKVVEVRWLWIEKMKELVRWEKVEVADESEWAKSSYIT
jgi:hypothetical protein